MLQVPITSFDSVGAAALIYLMFVIYHMFSRRRHSQNRRARNTPFIDSVIVIGLTAVNKMPVLKTTHTL